MILIQSHFPRSSSSRTSLIFLSFQKPIIFSKKINVKKVFSPNFQPKIRDFYLFISKSNFYPFLFFNAIENPFHIFLNHSLFLHEFREISSFSLFITMAEVLSKSSVFSPTISHHHRSKSKVFPIKISVPVNNRSKLVGFSSLRSNFSGVKTSIDENGSFLPRKSRNPQTIGAKMGLSIGKAQRWWEKGLQPNMKEISGAEDLVDSLLKAGDKLVVVDFFSPGCGGCKALHPKICQLAEMNPDVQFLQVNYEEHKSMCYSLNVHVLPFFRFYRGVEGRVCSFSCTNATIKKFKDALAKYSPERCSLGPTKGLEEKELLALAANKDLSFTYTPKPVEVEPEPVHQEVHVKADINPAAAESLSASDRNPLSSPSTPKSTQDSEHKTLATAGR